MCFTSKVARFLITKSSIVMLRLMGTGSVTLRNVVRAKSVSGGQASLLDWVNVEVRHFKGVKRWDAQVGDT